MSFFSSTSRGGSSETPSPAGSKTAAPAAVALEVSPTRNGETDGGGGHRRSSTGTTTGEGTMTTTTTRTPHYHFLHSMILPATVKIQKELKGRKFKVRLFVRCQCVCMDVLTMRINNPHTIFSHTLVLISIYLYLSLGNELTD